MTGQFSGKTVFITGAGSGIGYQTALAFAAQRAAIIATDMHPAGLERLKRELEQLGTDCQTHILDVSDEVAFEALANELDREGPLPDIVVNNAGLGVICPFLDTSMADWRMTMDVNVYGVVLGCRLFAAIWQRRGMPGHLVNVSSMAAYTPPANLSAYVASKYAVQGLCEVLAMELAEFDIDISCVHPGVINTAIVQDDARMKIDPAQARRLQRHYVEQGVHPRVVADDIVRGVSKKAATILSGKGVGRIAFMKRLLPLATFRKLLVKASQDMGYLPEQP